MISATGSCSGIENYSRHLSGRKEGQPPPTLFEYLPKDTIIFIDESHVTIPQIRGMFKGRQIEERNSFQSMVLDFHLVRITGL